MNRWITLAAALLLSGCSSAPIAPQSRMIRITVVQDAGIDDYCKTVMHSLRDDDPDDIESPATACANSKEIAIGSSESVRVLAHELRHALEISPPVNDDAVKR